MKFFLSGLGNMANNIKTITEAVIEADQLGFDGALMPDHYMWGDQIGHSMPHPNSTLETWTTFSYLAGKTENIHLGTLITPLPFRPPGLLAKRLSTLDILSGGRVILGVGAGWSKVEFDGYSVWGEAKYRVDKTIEALDIILKLWTEDEVTYKGKFYDIKGAVLEPKPVQKPYPKLLFGSSGKRMLNLTGKYGDICFVPPWMAQRRQEIQETVKKAAEKAGRLDKLAFMTGEMGSRGAFDVNEAAKKVEAAKESGAKYYSIGFPRDSLIESMKLFAEEVMPSFK